MTGSAWPMIERCMLHNRNLRQPHDRIPVGWVELRAPIKDDDEDPTMWVTYCVPFHLFVDQYPKLRMKYLEMAERNFGMFVGSYKPGSGEENDIFGWV